MYFNVVTWLFSNYLTLHSLFLRFAYTHIVKQHLTNTNNYKFHKESIFWKKSIFSLENLYIYWSISISRTLHLPICTYFYSLNMQSMSICYSFRFPQHEKHVPQRLAFSLHVKHICIKRHAAIVVFSAYFFQKKHLPWIH